MVKQYLIAIQMKFEILPPPPFLRTHVQYFWKATVDSMSPNFMIRSFADDSTGIIFQHREGRSCIYNESIGRNIPEAFLYGMTTAPMESQSHATFSAVGAAFHPFVIQELFRTNAVNFTDQLVSLEDLGLGDFSRPIIDEDDPDNQLKLLADFLSRKIQEMKRSDVAIKHAIIAIQNCKGQVRVQDLYKISDVSARQFERRFLSCTGVSPRHFIQVSRFQEFIKRIRTGDRKPLSHHAYDLGYADQSHFIRVIKRFSGLNPKAFRQYSKDGFLNLLSE
jgi:AraC-like DNA-binding protein